MWNGRRDSRRNRAPNKLNYALNDTVTGKNEISMKTKMTAYRTMHLPVLTFGK